MEYNAGVVGARGETIHAVIHEGKSTAVCQPREGKEEGGDISGKSERRYGDPHRLVEYVTDCATYHLDEARQRRSLCTGTTTARDPTARTPSPERHSSCMTMSGRRNGVFQFHAACQRTAAAARQAANRRHHDRAREGRE